MKRVALLRVGLAAVVLGTAGCYHATIETGLAPSGQTIEKPWAHSFLAGLVPPSVVETASKCPHGVAKVETKLSFLNQIANAITFGIYTPMSIKVECAAERMSSLPEEGGNVFAVAPGAAAADLTRALGQAAEYSQRAATPAYVVFSPPEQ